MDANEQHTFMMDTLETAILVGMQNIYTPEYNRDLASDPVKFAEKRAEILGILVSKWARWDGDKIMDVLIAALEDANNDRMVNVLTALKEL